MKSKGKGQSVDHAFLQAMWREAALFDDGRFCAGNISSHNI